MQQMRKVSEQNKAALEEYADEIYEHHQQFQANQSIISNQTYNNTTPPSTRVANTHKYNYNNQQMMRSAEKSDGKGTIPGSLSTSYRMSNTLNKPESLLIDDPSRQDQNSLFDQSEQNETVQSSSAFSRLSLRDDQGVLTLLELTVQSQIFTAEYQKPKKSKTSFFSFGKSSKKSASNSGRSQSETREPIVIFTLLIGDIFVCRWSSEASSWDGSTQSAKQYPYHEANIADHLRK